MTDKHHQTWLIAWEALRSLSRHYSPVMERVATAEGIDPNHWGMLVTGISFDPDPISEDILQIRIPYQRYAQRLETMHRQGLLLKEGDVYLLSPESKRIAQKIIQAAYESMDKLAPLKPPEMHCLNQLLRKVVMACLEAPEPPGKWCIKHARRLDPGESAGMSVKLDQYLSDLGAYRDDSHLAAWKPYGVDGHTWEIFTMIYQKEASDFDGLVERLRHRGFTEVESERAIDVLIEKKWIREKKDRFQLTEPGENIRQKTEEITNQYFFAPWSVITIPELEMMENLLQMVIVGLD